MIEIHIRDKNRIVNVTSPGKTPLRGRMGSGMFFYNPLDYLLTAIGICAGGQLIDYCRLNELNPIIFETITLLKEDNNYLIIIKRPEDFEDEHLWRIAKTLSNCAIASELKKDIEIKWEINEIPTKELLKLETKRGCCGS